MTANQVAYWNLQETGRHNRATETETNRHNVVTEGIDLGNLNEKVRHNKATEGIDIGKLQETMRHNVASEGIGAQQANAAQTNAAASLYSAQEQNRHNLISEKQNQQVISSQSLLNTANRNLANVRAKYEQLRGNATVNLTESQIKQIDQNIRVMESQINKMNSEINHMSFQNIDMLYDDIMDAWGKANGTIDAIIPF